MNTAASLRQLSSWTRYRSKSKRYRDAVGDSNAVSRGPGQVGLEGKPTLAAVCIEVGTADKTDVQCCRLSDRFLTKRVRHL